MGRRSRLGNLGADIYTTTASYATVLADLTAHWQGPAAAAMTKAFEPHLEWLSRAAAQAEHVAAQAGTAAAAHDAAFAATVPPAVVEANRQTLMSLMATNVLGQNTPAIAAPKPPTARCGCKTQPPCTAMPDSRRPHRS